MRPYEAFNRTGFSKFLNRPIGRLFRVCAGTGFLILGYLVRLYALGIASLLWGVLPWTAGAFDVCYVSAALGGPLSGAKIRNQYQKEV